MNPTKTADDWMTDFFRKRQQGRRTADSGPPPYITGEGIVLVDRRTQGERRRLPGMKRDGQPSGA